MTCLLCPSPAVEGDPLHLCRSHGGLGPEWADFDVTRWLAEASAA
jgi:hypothetical protein